MSEIRVGDRVRLKTTYYGQENNGREVRVTKVRSDHPFPITVDLEGWHAPVARSEIHTFQDTLDEIGAVSAANNAALDEDEEEFLEVSNILSDVLYGADSVRVFEYIDKLRRNQ